MPQIGDPDRMLLIAQGNLPEPTPGTVSAALRDVEHSAARRSEAEDCPAAEARRLREVAFFCHISAHVLMSAEGDCILRDRVRPADLMWGAETVRGSHTAAMADAPPAVVTAARPRVVFWTLLWGMLDSPEKESPATPGRALLLWTHLVAGLTHVLLTQPAPPHVAALLAQHVVLLAREATWLADLALCTANQRASATDPGSLMAYELVKS